MFDYVISNREGRNAYYTRYRIMHQGLVSGILYCSMALFGCSDGMPPETEPELAKVMVARLPESGYAPLATPGSNLELDESIDNQLPILYTGLLTESRGAHKPDDHSIPLCEHLIWRQSIVKSLQKLDDIESFVDLDRRWRPEPESPTILIPVCWEKPAADLEATAHGRTVVQKAIAETWEQATQSVRFTGWGTCPPSSGKGIRIRIADDKGGAHTSVLGMDSQGKPTTMVLNFTFRYWKPRFCDPREARDECIRLTAVHEFGHALGLAHEQNRPDAPSWCDAEKRDSHGTCVVCSFDDESVMNYCKPNWDGRRTLSDCDVAAVRLLYDGSPGIAEKVREINSVK